MARNAETSRSWLKLGVDAYNRRRYREAVKAFDLGIEETPADPEFYWLRALAYKGLGLRRQSLADVSAALKLSPASKSSRLKAENILGKSGPAEPAPKAAEERSPGFDRLWKQGHWREAFESLERAIRFGQDPAANHLKAAKAYMGMGDHEAALSHIRQAARLEPERAQTRRLEAALRWRLGEDQQALRAVEKAIRLEPDSGPGLLWAGGQLMRLGRDTRAESVLRKAALLQPSGAQAHAALAKLELWRGRYRRARELARRALAADKRSLDGWRALGGALASAGPLDSALSALDQALALAPADPEARLWRGEVLRRLGRAEEGLEDIRAALKNWPEGDQLMPRIHRALALMRLAPEDYVWRDDSAEAFELTAAILPSAWRPKLGPRECEAALLRLLERFRGNRTESLTFARTRRGCRLSRFRAPFSVRELGRKAQSRIRYRSLGSVLAEFERLLERFPAHPLLLTYRGEVKLWVGDYEGAQEDFQRALEREAETRWAYIGMGAAALMRGEPRRALAWHEAGLKVNPVPGRTLFVYRGEALRRLGDFQAALKDFRRAIELDEGRLGAWINLALTLGALGNERGLRAIASGLARRTGPLVADACETSGVSREPDLARMPPAEVAALLERCLESMRGNRSSTIHTHFDREGRLKAATFSAAGSGLQPLDRPLGKA